MHKSEMAGWQSPCFPCQSHFPRLDLLGYDDVTLVIQTPAERRACQKKLVTVLDMAADYFSEHSSLAAYHNQAASVNEGPG